MQISYFIGVDGGGSGTRARVRAADGRLVGEGDAGPSGLSQGLAQAGANVQAAISAAFGGALPPPAACAVGLGLAGAHDATQRHAFAAAAPRYARCVLTSDSHTALLGAHGDAPGAVVIAGTGSVGEAVHADGRRQVVGGWGFPVGDEGSGAWLGQRAMALAQQACDGRAAAGPLAQAVWRQCGTDEAALRAWCLGAGQHRYAQLAPIVFEHAAADPAAARLLDDAARALATLARALDPQGSLPLCLLGSVGQRLAPRLPGPVAARLVMPAGDAVDGALALARHAAG